MRTTLEEGVLTLFPEGHIDSKNAAEFEREIMAAIDGAPGASIVVNAADLAYVSSAGLRVLMKAGRRSAEKLRVTNVSPEVYEIFDMTGFTELLDVRKRLREISVEGCELIGSGGFGKVYRLDDETIAKVYSPELGLDFVERERDISQKAFLMGVPTAISFDVVRCGDAYGVVFEMLDALTTAQIIDADPAKIPQVAGGSAMLLKQLHTIVPGPDAGLPDRKQQLVEWVDSFAAHITEEEASAVKAFINSIPDRDTFLHGDFNAKNIMMQGGEFQLIDIGDAAIGHPIFDVAGLMLAYIILPNSRGGIRSDEDLRRFLGFDFDLAQKVWGVMCGTYFGVSSPEEIGAITQRLMPYCILLMTYQSIRLSGSDEESLLRRIELVFRQKLLPAIEHVAPLDF